MRPPSDLSLDNPLWRTALSLWSDAAVAEACLALQSQGLSVSRLLTGIWLAAHGVSWTGDEDAAIRAWRADCTGVLRQLRQTLAKNTPADTLRDALKRAELEAERLELAWIYQTRRHDCHNMYEFSVYNEELLIRNLRAATLQGDNPTAFEAGMNQLINALRAAHDTAADIPSQGRLSS